jgi:hypothetical protein
MFVYLLLAGGLLYGSAAFAGGPAYLFAGLVLAAWLVALGARFAWRAFEGTQVTRGTRVTEGIQVTKGTLRR